MDFAGTIALNGLSPTIRHPGDELAVNPHIPSEVESKLPELRALCDRLLVRRLDLFGSSVTNAFDPKHSDLDFVLEFQPEAKRLYPDVYFDLRSGLESLFGRNVDLVMIRAVRNPVFRREIEDTRVGLYAA